MEGKAAMQFYFIRHGQSTNNRIWDTTGSDHGRSADPELTDLGWRQSEALAEYLSRRDALDVKERRDLLDLSGFGITHLYCSLMLRAVATGTLVARALELPLVAWPDVHETGGIFLEDKASGEKVGQPGNSRAYFEQHYPDLVLPDTLGESGWWNRPFEGDEERVARAQRFLKDLTQRHGDPNDHVAVISHGGFYNQLLATLLELPRRDKAWFYLHNAAITRIDFEPEGAGLMYMNRFNFLPKELIS